MEGVSKLGSTMALVNVFGFINSIASQLGKVGKIANKNFAEMLRAHVAASKEQSYILAQRAFEIQAFSVNSALSSHF